MGTKKNFIKEPPSIKLEKNATATSIDCLTRIKVGISIYQLKALFKGGCQPSKIFNFF